MGVASRRSTLFDFCSGPFWFSVSTAMSGTVPTACVEFCIWQVTAERSQVDPLIAETAGEATGLVDSAAARFSSEGRLSWRPLSFAVARPAGGRAQGPLARPP